MGCDIHGWVEVKKYDFSQEWYECINIKSIVGRNYDMFALLFGVCNDASFIPVAPDRGLPAGLSDKAKADYEDWGEDAHSPSWITWEEITRINWNERGTRLANRVFCYKQDASSPFASFGWSTMLSDEDCAILNSGSTVEKFDPREQATVLYRREVQKVSGALSIDWQCLFDLMRCLDEYHRNKDSQNTRQIVESRALPALSEDNSKVRLVVWFDN